MAVGYSNDRERWTFARPVLVFRGGPYVLDAPAVQEYQMSALSMPAETNDAIRKCNVEMWLFPKGAEPFKGPNVYPQLELAELFPDSFKQAFRESYERVDATSFFDVWRCRNEARR